VHLRGADIQPDNEVEHGRAESRFFPCWASEGPPKAKEDGNAATEELDLPHTPNKGAYYIEGVMHPSLKD